VQQAPHGTFDRFCIGDFLPGFALIQLPCFVRANTQLGILSRTSAAAKLAAAVADHGDWHDE
jgi:hypothetical protein